MYGYIYMTTNNTNGIRYIGQKKSKIFLGEKYLGSGKILKQAVEKEGAENFTVELIEECNSKEELDEKEIYWISFYNAQKSRDFYNISKGGDAGAGGPMFAGHKHSKETKDKMSDDRKGSKNANYGNRWSQSDELKQKHSELSSGENNGMFGKHHSDEAKNIQREKALKYCWVCNDNTKETLRILKSDFDEYVSRGFRKGRIINKK